MKYPKNIVCLVLLLPLTYTSIWLNKKLHINLEKSPTHPNKRNRKKNNKQKKESKCNISVASTSFTDFVSWTLADPNCNPTPKSFQPC